MTIPLQPRPETSEHGKFKDERGERERSRTYPTETLSEIFHRSNEEVDQGELKKVELGYNGDKESLPCFLLTFLLLLPRVLLALVTYLSAGITYPTVLPAFEYYLPGDQVAGSQSHQVVANEKRASTTSCNLGETDLRLETRDGHMMRAEWADWFWAISYIATPTTRMACCTGK